MTKNYLKITMQVYVHLYFKVSSLTILAMKNIM